MSNLSPQDVEQRRQQLLDSARAETPDAQKKAAGFAAVVSGEVTPLGIEGPSLTPAASGARRVLLLGALALLMVAALLWFFTRPEDKPVEPPVPQVVRPVPPVPVVPQVVKTADPALVEPALTVEPVAALDAGAPVPIDAGVVLTPKKALPGVGNEVDSLARELMMLDEAKGLIGTDAAAALQALNRHRGAFPRGALKVEADLLRVEVLLKLNRRADAEKLAARLRAGDTEGLVRERLQRLLEQ